MATYDDYDGVYFTIQNIRLNHSDIMQSCQFLIVDNNPKSKHGEALKAFCKKAGSIITYVENTSKKSTSIRNVVFDKAETEYVLCLDCHVLVYPGSIKKLIDYIENNDDGDLIQGPLLSDDIYSVWTHLDRVWRSGMYGIWSCDKKQYKAGKPFEIPSQGLGLFACRREKWLRFNENFRGFGGEECYIHDKYIAAGKKTICLPDLKWVHRFARPNGVPYKPNWEDRVFNYFAGALELGQSTDDAYNHFTFVKKEKRDLLLEEAKKLYT